MKIVTVVGRAGRLCLQLLRCGLVVRPLLVSGGQVKTCPAVGRDSAGPSRGSLRENQPAWGVQPVEM